MALARVVSFEGVSSDRMAEMDRQMQAGDLPELPASEVVVLHDPEQEKSVVVMFFETEDDYSTAHETLDAMPADETPGSRTSVGKYNVVARMKP